MKMVKKHFWQTSKALVTLVLSLGVFSSASWAVEAGEKAPAISAPGISGEVITLEQFRGKVVYVDFWATWCAPCRVALPWMNELQAKYRSQGLEVLTINQDSDRAAALKVLAQLQPEFVPAFDNRGAIASLYKLPAMPSSYLIDRDGVVRAVFRGFHEDERTAIESLVTEILKANGGRAKPL